MKELDEFIQTKTIIKSKVAELDTIKIPLEPKITDKARDLMHKNGNDVYKLAKSGCLNCAIKILEFAAKAEEVRLARQNLYKDLEAINTRKLELVNYLNSVKDFEVNKDLKTIIELELSEGV